MKDPRLLLARLAIPALIALLFLALIPQINLWVVRGDHWNGSYVVMQGDEPLYSAYIRSLIDGQPRRNDPFSATNNPIPESAFSIQFVPPYVIATLARIFNVSASTAMILLAVFTALASALAVFWLLLSVTSDQRLASAGVLFVLCLGGMAGGHGLVGILLKSDLTISALPFLRRYQPAASFPLIFLFMVMYWRAFRADLDRSRRLYSIGSGACLSILVFCYFYLWTAGAAWMLCFGLVWFVVRPSEKKRAIETTAFAFAPVLAGLLFYAHLLSQRSHAIDQLLIVTHTRMLDLFRVPEIIGMSVIAALFIAYRRACIELSDPKFIFALSTAFVPFLVFNQQVATGRAIQPFHYEAFVVNYLVLIALLITLSFWMNFSRRALLWLALLSFAWGFVEVALVSKMVWVPQAVKADETVPALLELRELSKRGAPASSIVYSPDLAVNRFLPTWTTQSTLLDMGGLDFGSVSAAQRKEFLYLHLYYSGTSIEGLRASLNGEAGTEGYARSLIFGHERITRELGGNFRPIQAHEVEQEVERYRSYVAAFSRAEVLKRPLTYAIVPSSGNFNFSCLDQWYERDQGQQFGSYVLYRLHTR